MVLDDVKKDLEQPRTAISARLKAMKRLPRLQISLLHKVFGFAAIANDSRCRPKQIVKMRHRRSLEVSRFVLVSKHRSSPL
jgi:hypothetical protein